MGVVRCQHCGAWVHDEAMGCPECGADPRTGQVPAAVKRWERFGEAMAHAKDVRDRFTSDVMASDLPDVEVLLSDYEAAAARLLGMLPEVVASWRRANEDEASLPSRDPADVLDTVLGWLVGTEGSDSDQAQLEGFLRGLSGRIDLYADAVAVSDSGFRSFLVGQTMLLHRTRALAELEHSRLGWKLQTAGEQLEHGQQERLAHLQREVGAILGPQGLNATLAWCVLHPGSRWETPPTEGVAGSIVSGPGGPGA